MPEQDISDLKVKLASLEGAVLAEIRHLITDVKNIDAKLALVATRREVEESQLAVVRRVEKLESNQSRLAWAVISGWIGGITTWIFFGSKMPGAN